MVGLYAGAWSQATYNPPHRDRFRDDGYGSTEDDWSDNPHLWTKNTAPPRSAIQARRWSSEYVLAECDDSANSESSLWLEELRRAVVGKALGDEMGEWLELEGNRTKIRPLILASNRSCIIGFTLTTSLQWLRVFPAPPPPKKSPRSG
ncbi:hypothetical protein C8J56DRAFT_1051058 [Mycena floridula]|nr:hypothetical protein C8J56DRAFT_1051058 [Mycena floridula]